MQKLYCFFVFLLALGNLQAQTPNPFPPTEVSIITIGPGTSLNDAFGHNIIRIKTRISDNLYDYGRYDFDDPNFYTNFAKGKLKYLQGKSSYKILIPYYIKQNRSIKEQVLDVTEEQRIIINNFLIENYKPENRAYLYDFFFDNCATKIRDITEISLQNNIQFNKPNDFVEKTFRDLIQDNLDWNSWGSLGIDVALGSVIDRQANPQEYMFLPEYIFKFFEASTFKNSTKPLVKKTVILNTKDENLTQTSSFLMSPFFIFSILGLFILFITYKDYKHNKRSVWLDVLGFFITGLIGVFILLLWFATDHTATAQNYNLLWAFVLNILCVYEVSKKEISTWFIKYLKFLIIMLCLLTLHWIIGIQKFALALIPILIALGVRYLFLIKHFSK